MLTFVFEAFEDAEVFLFFGRAFLFPPRHFLHIDVEKVDAVEECVFCFVGFEIAGPFVRVEVAQGDEDARFVGFAKIVVGGGAEGAHGGGEAHIGIDHGRDRGAESADAAKEDLIVLFVVAAVEEFDQFVIVGRDFQRGEGADKSIAVREVFLIEIEHHVFGFGIHLGVHGYFAKEVAGFGDFESEDAQSVPEVVERIHAFAEVVAWLEVGLNESATEFDGIGEVFVDKFVGILKEFGGRGGEGAVVAHQDVAAMDEAIATDDGFVLRVPDEQLFEAVGFGEGVELVDVTSLAGTTAVESEADFAQASDFLHDVGRAVSCGDIDFLATVIGFAKEVFVLQLGFEESLVNSGADVGEVHRRFF